MYYRFATRIAFVLAMMLFASHHTLCAQSSTPDKVTILVNQVAYDRSGPEARYG